MEFHEVALKLYIESALERHRIYIKKQVGEDKPWSEDEVYQNYFFCNVFRQYDKCSKWMIENIIPYNRLDLIIIYRYISTMSIYEKIALNCKLDDVDELKYFLFDQWESGLIKFNGCFLRNTQLKGEGPAQHGKAIRVPFRIIEEIEAKGEMDIWKAMGSLEMVVNWFKQFSATAGFMAYEYACDLEYTKLFNPFDKYTWANMGPGARRGLSLVLTGEDKRKIKKDEWEAGTRWLFDMLENRFLEGFPNEILSMREVEHWLCEFQKYIKYRSYHNGGPKVKIRKYKGVDK